MSSFRNAFHAKLLMYYLNLLFSSQEWIQAIKPLCSPQLPRGRAPTHNVTEVRSLHLTLLEAHRLPVRLVPHPFCIISLNQVKVCRTQVKCPPDPIWEEDFILE